jgi:hypothetical protein
MLRQFLVGGGVSVVNIAIHALVMTIVVRVAQARGVQNRSHSSLFLIAIMHVRSGNGQVSTTIAVMGVDIGKNSFHVVGLDQRGAIVLRQRWSRGQVESRLANMPRDPNGPRPGRGEGHCKIEGSTPSKGIRQN